MLLMIDNYDSFTYNIVQYLGELGETIEVFRNDRITIDEIEKNSLKELSFLRDPVRPTRRGYP
jgi:anthranilate/para-aminobenzoate synthase component II